MKFKSIVIKGRGVGTELGFPTINLELNNIFSDINQGVYICKVTVDNQVYKGVMHFGPRKSFDEVKPSLEIFLIGFTGEIYGETVEVEIFDKIRDIQRFSSRDDLKEQIRKDIEIAEKYEVI